ncbi:serine/threonine-protein kinase DCLK3-like isoform X3 [Lineus longissimus]|uniref:serine/threonine-protein kinase DCLK3-like isoform X3 n=1 Tax=Lineus longissimus TaxID=88925 RepID=UPI00315DFC69
MSSVFEVAASRVKLVPQRMPNIPDTGVVRRRIRPPEEIPGSKESTGQDGLDPRKQAHHHNKHNHFPGYNSDQFPTGAFRPYYNRGVYGGFNPNRHYRSHMYPRGRGPQGQVYPGKNFLSQSDDIHNKPKVVTVVRNGDKPRNIVKILLNKRSVQSYEQLMSDISESFGPKWKNNRVRKLFTVRGKEVQSISDFFRNDDLFIAVGTEPLTVNEVADILKEVAPDSTQAKTFKKEWEKQKRKKQDVENVGDLQEGEREDKRDSGFGESESQRDAEDRDDVIYVPPKHDPVRIRRKKPKEVPPVGEKLSEHENEVVTHLDTERKKAVDEDRLRTRKRMQKMEEAEKRALDEERRKRGLVPLKGTRDDPYRKMLEEREKERERQREAEKERMRKKKEREERRKVVGEEEGDEEQVRLKEEQERKKREDRKRRAEEKKRREEERRQEEEVEQEERRRQEEKRAEEKRKEEEHKKKEAEEVRKREKEAEEKRKQEKEEEERRKREEEKLRRAEEEQKIKGANSARSVDTSKKADNTKKVDDSPKKSVDTKRVEVDVEEEEAKDSGVGDEVDSTKETRKTVSSKSRKVEFAVEEKEKSESPKRRGSKQDSADKRHKRRDSVKDKENKTEDDTYNQKPHAPVEKKEHASRRRSTRTNKTKLDRQVSNAERVLDKYEVGKVMGDGNFAVVKACKLKNTNNEYAMKVIDKSKLKGKEHMIENEIAIMKRCTHPNIVKLKEEFETKEEIYLIMELVKGGDLFDAITQSVKFTEKDSAHMVKDLCNALYYLHSRHVVHRDLKPENLLVQRTRDGSMTLKLADFGLAMDVKEPIYTVCGTPTYVAPEILSEIGYGLEVDMWALGVITYILLCGFPPFRSPDRNQTELFEYIKAGEYEFLSPYWDGISRSAKDLIENLLIVDRRRRYKAVDVLTHPWIVTLANTQDVPSNMAEHRLTLRADLELQAKTAWDAYRLQYLI